MSNELLTVGWVRTPKLVRDSPWSFASTLAMRPDFSRVNVTLYVNVKVSLYSKKIKLRVVLPSEVNQRAQRA